MLCETVSHQLKLITIALTGLPIGYSVIVALTGLPIGYSVIVALTVSLYGYRICMYVRTLQTFA